MRLQDQLDSPEKLERALFVVFVLLAFVISLAIVIYLHHRAPFANLFTLADLGFSLWSPGIFR